MILNLENLGKRYPGGYWGIQDFSLTLGPGLVGLLGPNGAGKSTLLRLLATLTPPSQGSIYWNGIDVVRHPGELRRDLGYLPQDFGVYPHLNAFEFLGYLAAAKGLAAKDAKSQIGILLDQLNLRKIAGRPLGTLSGGMRQRVGLAQALLGDPKLLIVDEPSVGLDPEERVNLRSLLMKLALNRIVLLSTHILSDVESIAQTLVLVDKGKMVQITSPEKLKNEAQAEGAAANLEDYYLSQLGRKQ